LTNFTLLSPVNETGLDFSLRDLRDLLCREEKGRKIDPCGTPMFYDIPF
jgi:hypothetical protein